MICARATLGGMALDDALAYRNDGAARSIAADPAAFTQDEIEASTLRAVYLDLKEQMERIDSWHAFDLVGQTNKLSLEQQIVAHQAAYDMVAPAFEAVENALKRVDEAFITRNGGTV